MALFGGATTYRFRPSGVFWFVARSGRWAQWFEHTGYIAITVGACTICCESMKDDTALVRHELEHTKQSFVLGVLFAPAYGLASLIAILSGKDPYHGNWFEERAYAVQDLKPPE